MIIDLIVKMLKRTLLSLMSTGCNVKDIGLCLSPTVYFSPNLN